MRGPARVLSGLSGPGLLQAADCCTALLFPTSGTFPPRAESSAGEGQAVGASARPARMGLSRRRWQPGSDAVSRG